MPLRNKKILLKKSQIILKKKNLKNAVNRECRRECGHYIFDNTITYLVHPIIYQFSKNISLLPFFLLLYHVAKLSLSSKIPKQNCTWIHSNSKHQLKKCFLGDTLGKQKRYMSLLEPYHAADRWRLAVWLLCALTTENFSGYFRNAVGQVDSQMTTYK